MPLLPLELTEACYKTVVTKHNLDASLRFIVVCDADCWMLCCWVGCWFQIQEAKLCKYINHIHYVRLYLYEVI